MKCPDCGRKVFRDVIDVNGKVGSWRMCVNCNTVCNFTEVFKTKEDVRGAFEYDFEN